MINTKDLRVGEIVWVGGLIIGKNHKTAVRRTLPTEGIVDRIVDSSYGGKYVYISNRKTRKDIHTAFVYDDNRQDNEDPWLFKTRKEAVEEYNKAIYNEIDLLQSLIDYNKKKIIE